MHHNRREETAGFAGQTKTRNQVETRGGRVERHERQDDKLQDPVSIITFEASEAAHRTPALYHTLPAPNSSAAAQIHSLAQTAGKQPTTGAAVSD